MVLYNIRAQKCKVYLHTIKSNIQPSNNLERMSSNAASTKYQLRQTVNFGDRREMSTENLEKLLTSDTRV